MDNLSNLSYDEGWKEAQVTVHQPEQELIKEPSVRQKRSKPVVIIAQVIICALIVLSAYIIKQFGGELYNNLHNWYTKELNDEVILNTDFDNFSIDKSFVKATD